MENSMLKKISHKLKNPISDLGNKYKEFCQSLAEIIKEPTRIACCT